MITYDIVGKTLEDAIIEAADLFEEQAGVSPDVISLSEFLFDNACDAGLVDDLADNGVSVSVDYDLRSNQFQLGSNSGVVVIDDTTVTEVETPALSFGVGFDDNFGVKSSSVNGSSPEQPKQAQQTAKPKTAPSPRPAARPASKPVETPVAVAPVVDPPKRDAKANNPLSDGGRMLTTGEMTIANTKTTGGLIDALLLARETVLSRGGKAAYVALSGADMERKEVIAVANFHGMVIGKFKVPPWHVQVYDFLD